jgi:hypothetical protein
VVVMQNYFSKSLQSGNLYGNIAGLLGTVYVGFITLFALDVWTNPAARSWLFLALLINLLPALLVVVLIRISRKYRWVGMAAFPLLGLTYMLVAWGRFHWSVYPIITFPLFLMGILYYLASRRELAERYSS